jgi:hypothetical protein
VPTCRPNLENAGTIRHGQGLSCIGLRLRFGCDVTAERFSEPDTSPVELRLAAPNLAAHNGRDVIMLKSVNFVKQKDRPGPLRQAFSVYLVPHHPDAQPEHLTSMNCEDAGDAAASPLCAVR